MTYPNDSNSRRRLGDEDRGRATPWIIGGLLGLVVILGAVYAMSTNDSSTASNTASPPATSAPATTGTAPSSNTTGTAR